MVTEGGKPNFPDWVSRLGLERFAFNDGVAGDALENIEELFGVFLPYRYKEFLQVTNGANAILHDTAGQLTVKFLPVAPGGTGDLAITEMNLRSENLPLFTIGMLEWEMFGFLRSDLSVRSEDCRVFEFIHEEREIVMLARSFQEFVADLSRLGPHQQYSPSYLRESGPVSWLIDEPEKPAESPPRKWWQFWKTQ